MATNQVYLYVIGGSTPVVGNEIDVDQNHYVQLTVYGDGGVRTVYSYPHRRVLYIVEKSG